MFNEIVQVLDKNPELGLNDILVTTLDIDNYAPYINAVFDNETITNYKNQTLRLPYNITGSRKNRQHSQLDTIKLLFNVPYHLPVSYLLDVLTQTDIGQSQSITANNIELIKTWLKENHTHFGYNALDYTEYGYHDYDVNSFNQLLNNLVLGACIPNAVAENQQAYPTYTTDSSSFTPYDNLDNSQIELANKLIFLINLFVVLREKLYLDRSTYREITLSDTIALLTTLKNVIVHDETSELHYIQFLGNLSLIKLDTPINLPIFNQLIDEYTDQIKTKIRFDGSITCASIQYMRNIPYKVIYILGMNFGEFPRAYNPNQLSILSDDWYLADRNYTNEDKQAFLDTILACNRQLFISYVGRIDTDNSEIKPSPLLDLLLNTIGQSFTDFQIKNSIKFDYHNLLVKHSLHPFYNNSEPNFSSFWAKISQTTGKDLTSRSWNFINPPNINLTQEQQTLYYKPMLNRIISTFCFTNANLYNTLGIRNNHEIELDDYEPLLIKDKSLAKQLFKYFEQYQDKVANNTNELYEYLTLIGILGYKNLGITQFQHYLAIYQNYIKLRGHQTANLKIEINVTARDTQIYNLIINDTVWLDAENNIIICEDFYNLNGVSKASANDIPLQLRIKANLIYLLIQNGGKCSINDNSQIYDEYQQVEGSGLPGHKQLTSTMHANQEMKIMSVNNIAVNSVILRLIDSVNSEKFDYTPSLQDDKHTSSLLNSYLRYYLYSLTNPIPIHKNSINTYLKNINKNPQEENIAITQAKNVFAANYENYDLQRLKEDIIFSSLMPDYFEFCANNKIINHIITMGKLLANINFKGTATANAN
jgi:exonuclease V gamma subunit